MFYLDVEAGYADYEVGHVKSRLPSKWGNAVLILLTGLGAYCVTNEDERVEKDYELFYQFEIQLGQSLCETFEPILHCRWSEDGGIGGDFQEDEYEWYLKRNAALDRKMTEAEFRQFVRDSTTHWSPIDAVAGNVQLLIDLLKNTQSSHMDELYPSEHILPALETLQDTLNILKNADFEMVRLNFI